MYMGDVSGVGSNDNIKWSKKLVEELDKLDDANGKADGKIKKDIWNGFLKKAGSKGNAIQRFIKLHEAEKSFDYYASKKDVGVVDWQNWENILNEYKKDLGLEISDAQAEYTQTNTQLTSPETIDEVSTLVKTDQVKAQISETQNEPLPNLVSASEAAEAFKDAIDKFQKELGIPEEMQVEIPTHADSTDYKNEQITPDGFKRVIEVDENGSIEIKYYRKFGNNAYENIGAVRLDKYETEETQRGYDYVYRSRNNIKGTNTRIYTGLPKE